MRSPSFKWLISPASLALAMLILPVAGVAQNQQYLVGFLPGTTPTAREAAIQRAGAGAQRHFGLVDGSAVTVPNGNALQALLREPTVQFVVPDREVFAFQGKGNGPAPPPAPGEVTPPGVVRVGAPTSASNGDGIGVAIMDTGIDLNQTDLAVSSQSFSAFGGSCHDDHGHGTHASGIVAALKNGAGVVGVAPNAKLYCVKVLNAQGSGSDSNIIAGFDWINSNAALVTPTIRVVNVSLGRAGSLNDNPLLRAAVQQLHAQGIVVVVAAGNDAALEVSQQVPATYPEVLAVASTTAVNGTNSCKQFSGVIEADTASYFTTDGAFNIATRIGVTVSAPGEESESIVAGCRITSTGILSTALGGGTVRMSGTSMAAPHVTGGVARLMQSGLSGVEIIRDYIRSHSSAYGAAPKNSPTSTYSFDGEREGVLSLP